MMEANTFTTTKTNTLTMMITNTYHDDNLQEKVEICSSLKLLEQVEWKKCDHIVLGRFDPIVLK